MDQAKQREATQQFLNEHSALTRRYFLGLGAAGVHAPEELVVGVY